MKIEVTCKNLKNALARVSHAVAQRSPMLSLTFIHIKAEGDQITFSGSDEEIYLSISVEGNIKQEGEGLVHPEKFKNLLDSSDDLVSIEISGDEKNPNLKITLGKFRRNSQTLSLDKLFSTIKLEEDSPSFIIVGEALVEGLGAVDKSISQSEVGSDLPMTGVHFKMGKENFSLLSTNRQHVSYFRINTPPQGVPSFTLPEKAIDTLNRILPYDPDVEVKATKKSVSFKWEGGELRSKTVETGFPNVGPHISIAMKDSLQWCTAKRDKILKPLDRVAYVHEYSNLCLKAKEGILYMSNDAKGKKNDDLAEDLVQMESGADIDTFFLKGDYFHNAITSCHKDEFEFAADKNAFAVRSKDLRFISIIAYVRL